MSGCLAAAARGDTQTGGGGRGWGGGQVTGGWGRGQKGPEGQDQRYIQEGEDQTKGRAESDSST